MGVPTKIHDELISIYDTNGGECPCGMPFDVDKGLIPRMMFGARNGIANTKLVVVAKNPGSPIAPYEGDRYIRALKEHPDNVRSETLFQAMVNFGEFCHLC